jgi:hypothetical protein
LQEGTIRPERGRRDEGAGGAANAEPTCIVGDSIHEQARSAQLRGSLGSCESDNARSDCSGSHGGSNDKELTGGQTMQPSDLVTDGTFVM